MTSEFWRIVVFALVGFWVFSLARRIVAYQRIQRAYGAADTEQVLSLLSLADTNSRIALNVALGRYGEALRVAQERDARALDPACDPPAESWLHRINACEGLVELGRATEAMELLKWVPPRIGLLRSGRAVGLAWTLTCVGEHEEALTRLDSANPKDLGRDYCAEAFLTRALILLNLHRLDDARKALDECRRLTVRASTERNVLLLEARWQVMSGRIDEGLKTFAAARDHRWKCQGGSSLLALGDALRDAGRMEEARTCWSLAIERDAESTWAAQAKERLQPA